jgi:hypothetical protein
LIHQRLRLGIVSTLGEANYLARDKTFVGRVPRSVYRLTSGRRALDKYLVHMEATIQAVK